MSNSPLLDLAEHYYAVAADLTRNGQQQLDIAERLNRYADQLCEQNSAMCAPLEPRATDQQAAEPNGE